MPFSFEKVAFKEVSTLRDTDAFAMHLLMQIHLAVVDVTFGGLDTLFASSLLASEIEKFLIFLFEIFLGLPKFAKEACCRFILLFVKIRYWFFVPVRHTFIIEAIRLKFFEALQDAFVVLKLFLIVPLERNSGHACICCLDLHNNPRVGLGYRGLKLRLQGFGLLFKWSRLFDLFFWLENMLFYRKIVPFLFLRFFS
jgi:hypothetical protein